MGEESEINEREKKETDPDEYFKMEPKKGAITITAQ